MFYLNSDVIGNLIYLIIAAPFLVAFICFFIGYLIRRKHHNKVCNQIENTLPNFEEGVTTRSEVVKGMPKGAIVYKSSKDRIVYRMRSVLTGSMFGEELYAPDGRVQTRAHVVSGEDAYYIFEFEEGILKKIVTSIEEVDLDHVSM